MTEKVKLPKNVCDALDYLKDRTSLSDVKILIDTFYKRHSEEETLILNIQNPSEIMRALSRGYEVELTAEEQIKALWNEQEKVCDYANGIREGIKQTLRIHGIKYDWLDGAE